MKRHGRGRAKNVLKHRVIPKVRQMVPLAVFPVVLLAAFSFVAWIAAVCEPSATAPKS